MTEGSRPPGLPDRGQAALPTSADPSPRRRRGPPGRAQGGRPWPEAGPGCLEWKLDQEALVGAARQGSACSWWREKQGLRTPQSLTFISKSATSTHGEGDSRSGSAGDGHRGPGRRKTYAGVETEPPRPPWSLPVSPAEGLTSPFTWSLVCPLGTAVVDKILCPLDSSELSNGRF